MYVYSEFLVDLFSIYQHGVNFSTSTYRFSITSFEFYHVKLL